MPKRKDILRGLSMKYGSTLRKRYTRAFRTLKRTRICPGCGNPRFRRMALGIWRCPGCGHTTTGGAYDT